MTSLIAHTVIDCADPYVVAEWWKQVLGLVGVADEPYAPGDEECLLVSPESGHRLLFVEVPDEKRTKNRLHFDVQPHSGTRDEEVRRLVALGATEVADHRDHFGPGIGWVTLQDPWGNELCVLRSAAERAANPMRAQGELPRPVRVLTPADLSPADPTPGMHRELAFELPLLWAGQVVTDPGAVSGWHHHDKNESSLYVVRGVLRLEFEGHEGYLDAGPGDFVHVPAWTVHRESNPTDQPSLAVIARVGGGVPTVNVEGPPQR